MDSLSCTLGQPQNICPQTTPLLTLSIFVGIFTTTMALLLKCAAMQLVVPSVLHSPNGAPKKTNFRFATCAGIINGAIHLPSGHPKIQMTQVTGHFGFQEVSTSKDPKTPLFFVDTGVPHAVINSASTDPSQLSKEWSLEIQKHEAFQPSATNVTYLQSLSDFELKSISFERGVEGFTLACGTGAVAAAFAHFYRDRNFKEFPSQPLKGRTPWRHPLR